jgi:hypothetical protein
VLLDGDKSLPEASPQNRQDHFRYIRLNCHEAENLYLTDEVLAQLNLNWDQAVAKLTGEAATYGEKEFALAIAQTWDRRWVDLKNLINEISKILDSKSVHWTIRVGHAIGRTKPTGQLADFLGPQALTAFWPP